MYTFVSGSANYGGHLTVLVVVLVIAIGLLRIWSTYGVFWQTWDEPVHIAAGMEWLDTGRYAYDPMQPPLARVMSALPLYWSGVRGQHQANVWMEGNAILAAGSYERNLTLARAGVSPFFVIACLAVVLWSWRCCGRLAAILSLLLFSSVPSVLAHSGFATLDMPCAAFVAVALLMLDVWLHHPSLGRSAVLGVALGAAILTKSTANVFLIVSGGLALVIYALTFRRLSPAYAHGARRWIYAAGVVAVAGLLTIWAAYRFTISPWGSSEHRPHTTIDRLVGTEGMAHDLAYFVEESLPIPAPDFWRGLLEARQRLGWKEPYYLLGETRTVGWWYFYPVVLVFKTPLPFIVFICIGVSVLIRKMVAGVGWTSPFVSIAAVVGILTISVIIPDKGSRQILAIYPPLAVLAGFGGAWLWSVSGPRRYARVGLTLVLLCWHFVASARAHPDYVAYFNELAGSHPERIAVDSDLDWGQDLKRLVSAVRERRIDQISVRYLGSADLQRLDLHQMSTLEPDVRTTGWIAISELALKTGTGEVPYNQFSWLEHYEPVERIGKSIRLYRIER